MIAQEELEERFTFRVDADTVFVIKDRKVFEVTQLTDARGPKWKERPDLDWREML